MLEILQDKMILKKIIIYPIYPHLKLNWLRIWHLYTLGNILDDGNVYQWLSIGSGNTVTAHIQLVI